MKTNEQTQRRLSLRALLLLIFAAALSPVLVIGGIRWSSDVERDAQYRRETMTLVAQVAAGRAANALESAPAILGLIAAANRGDPCDQSLRDLVGALPELASLAVVDAKGKILCSTMDKTAGLNVSDRPWFVELQATGVANVQSTAIRGAVSGMWTIASARRIQKADGGFGGALVLGTPINSLVAQLEHSNLPRNFEVSLLDSSSRVFASKHWDVMDGSVMGQLKSDKPGFFELRSKTGESRQAAIVPLAGNEFYAMVSAPTPPPIALENVSAFSNFALPLLAWLLALITAWLAMDRLVLRWLDYLRRIAMLYASGKLSVQPLRAKLQAPGEINVLADTMEEMAVRIRDRTTVMESALEARDAAMKEIHHRVKNNLQIINSLLSLQGRKLKDKAAAAALDDARVRINALSLIHSSLYEHNVVNMVDTRSFFTQLAVNLGQALGSEDVGIQVKADIDDDNIDADFAVPLALFTAEAVTNSIKHGMPAGSSATGEPGAPSRILISYKLVDKGAILTIDDNGSGLANWDQTQGIGGTLLAAFARQVRGTLEEGESGSGGRYVRINIPNRYPITALTATA